MTKIILRIATVFTIAVLSVVMSLSAAIISGATLGTNYGDNRLGVEYVTNQPFPGINGQYAGVMRWRRVHLVNLEIDFPF